jgi:adenylate cyclase
MLQLHYSSLPPALVPLVEAAERDSLRVAAWARGTCVLALFVFFHLVRPPELPTEVVILVSLALAVIFLSVPATLRLADAPQFHKTLLAVPTGLDLVVFLGLSVGTAWLLNLPVALLPDQPPFMLLILLLALGALRYGPATVLIITAVAVGYLLVVVALQRPDVPALAQLPIFAPGANLVRAALLAAAGIVLALVVTRARRRLVEALAIGERASNLARYLPRGIADQVGREGLDALSRGREQQAAVLFADIVGFTALAERMEARAVGALLTEVRSLQRRAIEDAGGFVDKFIGDAVMGVFGVIDDQSNAARQALTAARTMHSALATWKARRGSQGEAHVDVGIGIHYGTVFAGAVGDDARLEFAVLGDTVNVAQRCEALTRELGVSCLASRSVIEAAGEEEACWRQVGVKRLRGRAGEIDVLAPANWA